MNCKKYASKGADIRESGGETPRYGAILQFCRTISYLVGNIVFILNEHEKFIYIVCLREDLH